VREETRKRLCEGLQNLMESYVEASVKLAEEGKSMETFETLMAIGALWDLEQKVCKQAELVAEKPSC